MPIDIASAVGDGKVAVLAAGVLIVSVVVATRVFDWIRLVLIEREASREYEDRYGG